MKGLFGKARFYGKRITTTVNTALGEAGKALLHHNLKYSWEFIEIFCKNNLKKEGDKDSIDITDDEFKKWVYGKWNFAPERNMKQYGHDAMFPEELVKRCLKLFSYQNDIILDPFNGAGTTTKVAKQLGRRFIGIDISEKYCEVARARLKEVTNLFN
ncbi:hypothetical protein JP0104_05040 [Helicobacter pylori]|nr:site-specific DNA-methyltransferase [Helicobacter pylori]GHR67280.1 hypothetical protein JP0104_05040 [Helicobacter pylori]